jgi:hypothetical protein
MRFRSRSSSATDIGRTNACQNSEPMLAFLEMEMGSFVEWGPPAPNQSFWIGRSACDEAAKPNGVQSIENKQFGEIVRFRALMISMTCDPHRETFGFVRRNNSFRLRCFWPRRRPKRNGRRPCAAWDGGDDLAGPGQVTFIATPSSSPGAIQELPGRFTAPGLPGPRPPRRPRRGLGDGSKGAKEVAQRRR